MMMTLAWRKMNDLNMYDTNRPCDAPTEINDVPTLCILHFLYRIYNLTGMHNTKIYTFQYPIHLSQTKS